MLFESFTMFVLLVEVLIGFSLFCRGLIRVYWTVGVFKGLLQIIAMCKYLVHLIDVSLENGSSFKSDL